MRAVNMKIMVQLRQDQWSLRSHDPISPPPQHDDGSISLLTCVSIIADNHHKSGITSSPPTNCCLPPSPVKAPCVHSRSKTVTGPLILGPRQGYLAAVLSSCVRWRPIQVHSADCQLQVSSLPLHISISNVYALSARPDCFRRNDCVSVSLLMCVGVSAENSFRSRITDQVFTVKLTPEDKLRPV
ncbi:hypothetical protein BaRGS_00029512 [Batillaria attramentaria]|uniref:Uncharacterized protein n=1 Tax=Batillaria attramentaria TaxID=370345 RepID=A0ABD0JX37_9CAEN